MTQKAHFPLLHIPHLTGNQLAKIYLSCYSLTYHKHHTAFEAQYILDADSNYFDPF